jgi:hypothetical protein
MMTDRALDLSCPRPPDRGSLTPALLCLGLCFGLLAETGTARAQAGAEKPMSPEVRERFERAVAAAGNHEYDVAIAELRAAYEIEPRLDILFAWAQAARQGGDCVTAIRLYKEFLASDDLTAMQTKVANDNLNRCRRVLGPEAAAAAEADGHVADSGEASPPEVAGASPVVGPRSPAPPPGPPADRKGTPWYRDPLGGSLVGAGSVALGVGGAFYVLWQRSEREAEETIGFDAYRAKVEEARFRRRIAIAGGSIGGALVVAGVVRYLVRTGDAREPISASVTVDERGGALVVTGRF